MLTQSTRLSFSVALCVCGCICVCLGAADANAQAHPFVSHANHNSQAQHAFNQQNPHTMFSQAGRSINAGHRHIARLGYSNAMQTAYGHAFSNNPHRRLSGMSVLHQIASNRHAANHVRETAWNGYYDARMADSRRTAFASREHAFRALALRLGSHATVRVAPNHSRLWDQAQSFANGLRNVYYNNHSVMGSH